MPAQDTILVTGISGFIGLQVAIELLDRGFRVRGGLRGRAEREPKLREVLERHVGELGDRFEAVELDLLADAGWAEAVAGCRYVQHVASPVPSGYVPDPDALVPAARGGALRALRAAAAEPSVERVVLTSSSSAVVYGHPRGPDSSHGPETWSKPEVCGAYQRSKTLAERAAWDFIATLPEERGLELTTLCPCLVYGPVLDREFYGPSGEAVRKLLARELPAIPDFRWSAVDVRDVAWLHAEAMLVPEAGGQRFCVAAEPLAFMEVAQLLAEHFGPRGYRVPTRRLPHWLVRIVALFDPQVRFVLPDVGLYENMDCTRTREILSWKPRDARRAVIDMGESLIELGIV